MSEPSSPPEPPFRTPLLALLLFLLAWLPFLPALEGNWVYDDRVLIETNALVHDFEHAGRWWTADLADARTYTAAAESRMRFYRPLVVTSYALDYQLGGGQPWLFHGTNFLLHGATTVLAFFLARRWTRSGMAGFIVALLFAFHPTRAENVAWITGRPDLLATLFLFLSSECFAKSLTRGRPMSRLRAGSLTFGLLALFSKETALLLPVLWTLELWLHQGAPAPRPAWLRESFRFTWPSLALCLAFLAMRLVVTPAGGLAGDRSWRSYWLLLFETWGRLAELLALPRDLTLFASRIRTVQGAVIVEWPYLMLGVALGVAVGISGWWGLRAERLPRTRRAVGLMLAGVALALPVLQVVPTSSLVTAQARYLYLPSLLFFSSITSLLAFRRPALLVLGTLSFLGAVASWERSKDFASPRRFWLEEARMNPSVPEVISDLLNTDLAHVGRETALRRAACGYESARSWFAGQSSERILRKAVDTAAGGLPDRSQELLELADFVARILGGEDAAHEGVVRLSVPRSSVAARMMRTSHRPYWLLREAQLRARSAAEDQVRRVRPLIDEALASCPGCEDLLREAAQTRFLLGDVAGTLQTAARAGPRFHFAYRQALALRRRAEQDVGLAGAFTLARAAVLVGDFPWATRVLRPYADELIDGPDEGARAFLAQVASRSGDLGLVETLLETSASPPRQLSRQLGLVQPVADRHAPFVAGTCLLPSELR